MLPPLPLLPLLLALAACAPATMPAASRLTESAARTLILDHPLTDVRTGQQFRLGQFGGVTLVMNAALW